MSKRSEYVLADDVPADTWQTAETDEQTPVGTREEAPAPDTVTPPSLEEVLRVVFDIGVGERETYLALAARECGSAGDLAEDLDRDRSNVNRYLNRLFQNGLVTRRRRILQSGGHLYQYSARPPDEVRALLRAGLREWLGTADDHIETLLTGLEGDSATDMAAPEETTCRAERR